MTMGWKEAARQALPHLDDLIGGSDSLGEFWLELVPDFGAAHQDPINPRTIRGVWDFARWSTLESGDRHVANACYCHFLEHLDQLGEPVRVRTAQDPGTAAVRDMMKAAEALWMRAPGP